MKPFTNLIVLTAATMAIPTMAAPSIAGAPGTVGLKPSDSEGFPDSLCGAAVEYELPVSLESQKQAAVEWCCDVSNALLYDHELELICMLRGIRKNTMEAKESASVAPLQIRAVKSVLVQSGCKYFQTVCAHHKMTKSPDNSWTQTASLDI